MTKGRIALIVMSLGAIAVLAALAAIPWIVESKAQDKLRASLQRRGIEASWDSFEVSYGGDVEVRGLSLKDPARGVDLQVQRVAIDPAAIDTLLGEPRLERIEVESIRVSLDAQALKRSTEEKTPKKPEDASTKKPPSSLLKRLQRSLKEQPPELLVRDMDAKVRWGELKLFEAHADAARLGAKKTLWSVDARGRIKPLHPKIPKVFRRERPWHLRGSVDVDTRDTTLHVSSGEEGRALVDFLIPETVEAKVGGLGVEATFGAGAKRTLTLHATDVATRVGLDKTPIALASFKTGSLDLLQAKPLVQLDGATLEVTPARLNELAELKGKLLPSISSMAKTFSDNLKGKPPKPKPKQSTFERIKPNLIKAVGALWSFDASAQNTSLVVRIEREEQQIQRVTLAQGLFFELHNGEITARGESTDGTFDGHVRFAPRQLMPLSAMVEAKGFNLSKLPGMASGRTLPSRGIRGKVGGLVDMSAVFLAPAARTEIDVFGSHTLDVSVQWRDGMLDLNGVADEPLEGINLSAQGSVRWQPHLSTLALERGRLNYGPLVMHVEGDLVDWPLRPFLSADMRLESTSCQSIFSSLPEAMLGPYKDVILGGQVAPRVQWSYPLKDPWRFKWTWTGLAEGDDERAMRARPPAEQDFHCTVRALRAQPDGRPEATLANGGRLATSDVGWLNRPFVKRVEEGTTGAVEILVGPGTPEYVRYEDMPPFVGGAAYLSEEIMFLVNRGLSLALIAKAIRVNLDKGRFVYGGSTVTQQLVKNLFLTRRKTLARKLQEALVAFRMDEAVEKVRLLELYLNIIEFGEDLYGIGPAAQFYFQRPASQLTPKQAVFLAMLKPSPKMGNRLKRRGTTPEREGSYFIKRMGVIMDRLVEYELLTQAAADAAKPYVLKWDKQGNYIEPELPTVVPELFDPLDLLPGGGE